MGTPPSAPLYETAADNWAMSASSPTSFYALVQADTILYEPGWNAKLASVAYAHSDVFQVGGRCAGDFVEEAASAAGAGGGDASANKRAARAPTSRQAAHRRLRWTGAAVGGVARRQRWQHTARS